MLPPGGDAAQPILTCSVSVTATSHAALGAFAIRSVSNKKHCKSNIYVELKKLGTKDVKYLAISFFS